MLASVAGSGGAAGDAVGQGAGILAVIDEHVVLLIEVLALQIDKAEGVVLQQVG